MVERSSFGHGHRPNTEIDKDMDTERPIHGQKIGHRNMDRDGDTEIDTDMDADMGI
jgi:hypothetical protein